MIKSNIKYKKYKINKMINIQILNKINSNKIQI